VNPEPERQMLTRPRAVDDETIRVLDLFGIAVARDVPLCRQPAGGDAADELVGGNPEALPADPGRREAEASLLKPDPRQSPK
jgi:hypothetical protein